MQISGFDPTNRIQLDGLEPSTLARPAVALPPRQDTSLPQAPDAASSGVRPTGGGPRSPIAIELDAAFKDLRASLGESTLANGGTFQARTVQVTSDVLVAPDDLGQAPSVNTPAPAVSNLERFPTLVDGQPFQPRAAAAPPPQPAPPQAADDTERPVQDAARSLGDATLASLGAAIDLQAGAGRFQLDVNGQTLNFRADQTLNEVLSGISSPGTGARATLDPRGRITVESASDQELSITDRRGNLASSLGIAVTPSENANAALSRELQDFADGLNRALVALENRPQATPEAEVDAALKELEAALSGAFSPSSDGSLQTLGDLGFRREGGEVRLDAQKLEDLVTTRTDEVNRVVTTFVGETAQPLLQSGERVAETLDDATAEARQAAQDVRIQMDVARLQVRQQTLTLDRTATENLRERVARQSEALANLADQLADRVSLGLSQEAREARAFADQIAVERPRERPVAASRIPLPQALTTPVSPSGSPVAG